MTRMLGETLKKTPGVGEPASLCDAGASHIKGLQRFPKGEVLRRLIRPDSSRQANLGVANTLSFICTVRGIVALPSS